VNARTALATLMSSPVEPVLADDEMSLAALLDLFEPEELAAAAPTERPSPGAGLRVWTQTWVRRATHWGAGPRGSWRAW
jgi:hypothetical protein